MKTTHIFFTFLFLLFVFSCGNHDNSNYSLEDAPIIIDIDSAKTLPLKISHIQYVPLETTNECLIGNVDKILIRNDKIYVADFSTTKSLFIFDIYGKFLFKIERIGQSGSEYISFHDFDIQKNGDIFMFDNHSRKFLVFNSAGEYLMKFEMDNNPSHFCLVDDKMYLSLLKEQGKMVANLAVYDMMQKRTDFLFTDKKFLHNPGLMRHSSYDFYYSPNRIYYSPKFSEIIYSITIDGAFPSIGIKNLHIPPEDVKEKWSQASILEQFKSIVNDVFFVENVYIYETVDYISIGCMMGVDRNILLYNKHSKIAYKVLSSDLFMNIGRDGIRGSTGTNFFSVVSFDSDNNYHKKILESRKELAKWKEEDNPVVVFFKLDMLH